MEDQKRYLILYLWQHETNIIYSDLLEVNVNPGFVVDAGGKMYCSL